MLKLWEGFPSSLSQLSDSVIDGYVEETAPYSIDALSRSVTQFRSGKVEAHAGPWVPSTAEFARNIRLWEAAIAMLRSAKDERDWLTIHGGITEVTFADRPIKLLGYTREQIEWVLVNKRLPETIDEIEAFRALGPPLRGELIELLPNESIQAVTIG